MKPIVCLSLSVQIATKRALPTRAQIRRWILAAISQAGHADIPVQILVRFVNAAEGRDLNQQFRGRDYATNVLTFPYVDEFPNLGQNPRSFCEADLVICAPIVEKEAREQEKSVADHYAHLIIHGTLHALGFDHDDEIEAQHMEELEARILKRFRIKDPYT